MPVRVRHARLDLSLAGSLAGRRDALTDTAETAMLPAVLARLGVHLEDRFGPEAIVRIPTLTLRWRVEAGGLDCADTIEAVAESLADSVAERIEAGGGGPLPPADAEAVLFRSRAHLTAVRLAVALTGRPAGGVSVARLDTVWPEALDRDGADLPEVLSLLSEMHLDDRLIAALPPEGLARASALPDAAFAGPPGARLREEVRRAAAKTLGASAETPPDTPPRPADTLPGADEPPASGPTENSARSSRDPATDAPAPEKNMPSAGEAMPVAEDRPWLKEKETARYSEKNAPSGGKPETGPADGIDGSPERDEIATEAVPPRPESEAAAQRPAPPAGFDKPESPAEAPDAGAAGMRLGYGGLFYFLNPIGALDLPGAFYEAGVFEGDAVCAILYRLAETAGLPPTELSGIEVLRGDTGGRRQAVPSVPAGCRAELVAAGEAALGVLARQAGREPAAVEARRRTLEARLRRDTDDPALPLAAWGGALALAAAEARLAGPPDGPGLDGPALERMVHVPALLFAEADPIELCLPMERIDPQLRRAGLDCDPGYLPWLQRKLIFTFLTAEDGAPEDPP